MARFASLLLPLLVAVFTLIGGAATAARISDISNTKHNLSKTGPGTLKSDTESQICVFCHTPHQAENIPNAPLWNRKLSSAVYDNTNTYRSSSIDASLTELEKGPGGLSRLCLSCHDGTMAIGSVNVANGKVATGANAIPLTNTGPGGTMTTTGVGTGFTRNLGVDMRNDHPISFTYDSTVANLDGELRSPDGAVVGIRVRGQTKPKLPLQQMTPGATTGQMQCTTCHDPHLRETSATQQPSKFLRLNRLQEGPPTGGTFSETNDIVCLACHDKGGQTWAMSAHAQRDTADEQFTDAAANRREFPLNLPVWRAACLSCHDAHTVQGARRLLREGTDSTTTPKGPGGSAIEETCYQCHSTLNATTNALKDVTNVPNIKSDFSLAVHMPITSLEQAAQSEVHDIGTGTGSQRGKDFYEDPSLLGLGNANNRHVECTDCHNPHRVLRARKFNDNPDPLVVTRGTHDHNPVTGSHTNIASGVLKGSYGVEPVYGGAAFTTLPTGYTVKRGDGKAGASEAVGSAWVTREYQVCLKCHSSYAYGTSPPSLTNSRGGGTTSGTNGVTNFTDQAMEFQAPATHKGRASVADSGAFKGGTRDFQTNNHRSWHPVMDNTGRTTALRNMTGGDPWLAPWKGFVGNQTMYCTDCHGSSTAESTVVPSGTNPWGPHGSGNPFLLKGEWSTGTGATGRQNSYSTNALCFKCHDRVNYATNQDAGRTSGYYNSSKGNLHNFHTDKIGKLHCTWCHVAAPHGWKNKAFLVNLNDVGAEVGLPAGTEISITASGTTYTNSPYYNGAKLKVITFATSGNWSDTNCGSASGQNGSGINWMKAVCSSPP